MSFDRKYLVWAMVYLVIGTCLGIFMAASHRHGQSDTRARILLVGFVLSFVYGMVHRLWLGQPNPILAKAQFILHQAAAMTLSAGLLLLYGESIVPDARLEPIPGIASAGILVAALLMLYLVLRSGSVRT